MQCGKMSNGPVDEQNLDQFCFRVCIKPSLKLPETFRLTPQIAISCSNYFFPHIRSNPLIFFTLTCHRELAPRQDTRVTTIHGFELGEKTRTLRE